jgi:chloramphenicol O-acetyltransferase
MRQINGTFPLFDESQLNVHDVHDLTETFKVLNMEYKTNSKAFKKVI